jgi:hypothetical protein
MLCKDGGFGYGLCVQRHEAIELIAREDPKYFVEMTIGERRARPGAPSFSASKWRCLLELCTHFLFLSEKQLSLVKTCSLKQYSDLFEVYLR